MAISAIPTPGRLGLPPQFSAWRREQVDAIQRLCDLEARFIGLAMPTGSGKSATVVGYSQMMPTEDRMLILTATKTLQSQYMRDFAAVGMRDLRGKNNYRCKAASDDTAAGDDDGGPVPAAEDEPVEASSYVSVDHGPCFVSGVECSLRKSGCEWFDNLRDVRRARVVVTNYDKWIKTPDHAEEFGSFAVIVLDEAHEAESKLGDSLRLTWRRHDVERLLGLPWPGMPPVADARVWAEWARRYSSSVEAAYREAEASLKAAFGSGGRGQAVRDLAGRVAKLRELSAAITACRLMRGEWIADSPQLYKSVDGSQDARAGNRQSETVTIDPVWPAPYASQMLFRGIRQVVLLSATLRPKTMDILGIAESEREFHEYNSSFPETSRPIVAVSSGGALRMSSRLEADESTRRRLVGLVDDIIDARTDRRIIIPTVSYGRRNYIYKLSRHRQRMITHGPGSAEVAQAVRKFLATDPPAILISPSISTGWDFAYEAAECCIIVKIPFVDQRSAVMRRRCEIDRDYANYLAAEELTQTAGRIVRSVSDFGETIVVDEQMSWFPWRNRHLFARYFLSAIRKSDGPPPAPPTLRERWAERERRVIADARR